MKGVPTRKQFKKWSLPSKYALWGIVIGVAGLVVGAVSSGLSVYYAVRPNPRLVLLAKAIRAEKPTKLVLAGAGIGNYVGVSDKLVFVNVKNESNRPAYEFNAHLVAPPSTPIRRPQSTPLQPYLKNNLMIPDYGSLRFPVAYKKDLMSALHVPCIAGMTTSPNNLPPNSTAVGLALQINFKTVFNETKSTLVGVWAIVPMSCS